MVNEARLRQYLEFICERQRIWKRRFVENQDPPWTECDILRKYHFCHVHREHDRGTRYVINNILPHDDPQDVIFNVVVYRFLNKPDSYEIIGGYTPVADFDPDEAARRLQLWGRENTVFNPAYRITAQRFAGSPSKVENVFYGIIRDDLMEFLPEYTMGVIHADTMAAAHRTMTHLRGVGDFLAYEFITDLNYELLDFSENDFVNVGPGAQRGIERIWPDVEDYEDKVRYLQRYQEALFNHFDLDFPYWEEKPELTCRDIEHTLCEAAKWWRVKEGGSTRRFEPDDQDQSEMDDFV